MNLSFGGCYVLARDLGAVTPDVPPGVSAGLLLHPDASCPIPRDGAS